MSLHFDQAALKQRLTLVWFNQFPFTGSYYLTFNPEGQILNFHCAGVCKEDKKIILN